MYNHVSFSPLLFLTTSYYKVNPSEEDDTEMNWGEFVEEWLGGYHSGQSDTGQYALGSESEEEEDSGGEQESESEQQSEGEQSELDEPVEQFTPNHPNVLPAAVLQRSLNDAMLPPAFFCAICCKKLYPGEDMHTLVFNPEVNLNTIEWPCQDYGVQPTVLNGIPTVCNNHKELNNSSREFVSFFLYVSRRVLW